MLIKVSVGKSPNENASVVGRRSLVVSKRNRHQTAASACAPRTTNDQRLPSTPNNRDVRNRRRQTRDLRRQISLKLRQLRSNSSFALILVRQHVSSLKPVARNAEHGRLVRQNAVLLD